jgi:hypothetical protein
MAKVSLDPTGTGRKRGRPKKDITLMSPIAFRFESEIYQLIEKEAKERGIDTASLIRLRLREIYKPDTSNQQTLVAKKERTSQAAKPSKKLDTSIADQNFQEVLEMVEPIILEEDLEQIDQLLEREFEEEIGENGRKYICSQELEKLVNKICARNPAIGGKIGDWDSNLIRIYAHRQHKDWVEVGQKMGFKKEVVKKQGRIVKEYLT